MQMCDFNANVTKCKRQSMSLFMLRKINVTLWPCDPVRLVCCKAELPENTRKDLSCRKNHWGKLLSCAFIGLWRLIWHAAAQWLAHTNQVWLEDRRRKTVLCVKLIPNVPLVWNDFSLWFLFWDYEGSISRYLAIWLLMFFIGWSGVDAIS